MKMKQKLPKADLKKGRSPGRTFWSRCLLCPVLILGALMVVMAFSAQRSSAGLGHVWREYTPDPVVHACPPDHTHHGEKTLSRLGGDDDDDGDDDDGGSSA